MSTGTAALIGLLSFGAGIAVGAAISSNNYYYPRWGYGGVYYGGRSSRDRARNSARRK